MFVNCTLEQFFKLAAEQYGVDWQERDLFLVGLLLARPNSPMGSGISASLGEIHAVSGKDLHLFAPGHKYSGRIENFFRVDDRKYGFDHLKYQDTKREIVLLFPELKKVMPARKPCIVLCFFSKRFGRIVPELGCLSINVGDQGIFNIEIVDFLEKLMSEMRAQPEDLHLHLASVEHCHALIRKFAEAILGILPRLAPAVHVLGRS